MHFEKTCSDRLRKYAAKLAELNGKNQYYMKGPNQYSHLFEQYRYGVYDLKCWHKLSEITVLAVNMYLILVKN
mgnify:CR=1